MKATKESGQTDFEFTTDTFSEINMENFINQRKDGAFRKLTLGEKLQTMPPRSASNAVMSATFSAINEDEDTPSNQNYELIISFGYVIAFVIDFMYCLFSLLLGTISGYIRPLFYLKSIFNCTFKKFNKPNNFSTIARLYQLFCRSFTCKIFYIQNDVLIHMLNEKLNIGICSKLLMNIVI